jgi:hypothetical protein
MVAAGEGGNPAHSAVGRFYNLRSFMVLQQPREKTKTLNEGDGAKMTCLRVSYSETVENLKLFWHSGRPLIRAQDRQYYEFGRRRGVRVVRTVWRVAVRKVTGGVEN